MATLVERLDAIVALLAGLATTVAPYQGQLEIAVKQPSHGLPALLVSLSGAEFERPQGVGLDPDAPYAEIWRIVVVTNNQGGAKTGLRQALTLVNDTLAALTGDKLPGGERLWPVSVDNLELSPVVTCFALYFAINDIEDIDRGT